MQRLLDAAGEFRIEGTPWYLDARLPRARAIVSHAHSDHLGRHGRVVATPVTCALLQHRLAEPGEAPGDAPSMESATESPLTGAVGAAVQAITSELIPLSYGNVYHDGEISIELFPAGHVLGSAMPRVTTPAGRLLYTGDFRLKEDAATVPACRPPADGADVVLMECTYGLERYRFPRRSDIIGQLCDTLAAAQAEGQQAVCLCYSLGKAQEIARVLIQNGFAVTMHGAAFAITQIYRDQGVEVGAVRRYQAGEIEGTVLIAPPHIRNSRMITNIKNAHISVITGWAIDPSCKYRYQAHAAFPISDHADFDELNTFVDLLRERGTKQFLLTHGFVREFCSHLRSRGIAAAPARPPAQGALFEM
jgi:putative mRNA 3-end processing factor